MSENEEITVVNVEDNVKTNDIEVLVSGALGSKDLDKMVDEGLAEMVSRFLEDDEIDNDEMVELVAYAMEIVGKQKTLRGGEKKRVAMVILKKFMEKRVKDWDSLEKLISKAIDLGVSVSRNGINKIKITSVTIKESKTAFNLIYSSAMSNINSKYPEADDIINNLFDIATHILQIMEGQTQLKDNEKRVILRKVMRKVLNSLDSKLSVKQKEIAMTQVEPTVSMVMIALRAQNGQLSVDPVEVVTLINCLFGWVNRCFGKKRNAQKK